MQYMYEHMYILCWYDTNNKTNNEIRQPQLKMHCEVYNMNILDIFWWFKDKIIH